MFDRLRWWCACAGKQFGLVGAQSLEQAIQRGEAGSAKEDAIEADAQFAAALLAGGGTIRLEVGVEPPDQSADAALRRAVQFGERVEPVHQPFRMHLAQRMPTDRELTGVIADNDGLAQQPVCLDAAPQCAFSGDAQGA